jgi:hypothetical protein
VAPVPEHPLSWAGVLFVRKGELPSCKLHTIISDDIVTPGPYANAIIRFHIDFPAAYPKRPPVVTILNDVFHPLVTPLTTYSHGTRDTGAQTVSAADNDRLPPGGLSLRHGFPEWFESQRDGVDDKDKNGLHSAGHEGNAQSPTTGLKQPPHTVEILHYLRIVFSIEAMLDSVPLEAAANSGAWHAWRSYRSKAIGGRSASPAISDPGSERSTSPRQQPGGARRPGEWNWQGVWEDRVRKSIAASISEGALFGGNDSDAVNFSKLDTDAVREITMTLREQSGG